MRATAIPSTLAIACALILLSSAPSSSDTSSSSKTTTSGRSHQLDALEGCTNQWLFNGVWRVRVESVVPITSDMGRPGYAITVQFRNGTDKTTAMVSTGVPSKPGHLVLDDGNTLDMDNAAAMNSWTNNAWLKRLPASANLTHTINFYLSEKTQTVPKAVRWILDIDKSKAWKTSPHYTTADPSLRVNLTCDKSRST